MILATNVAAARTRVLESRVMSPFASARMPRRAAIVWGTTLALWASGCAHAPPPTHVTPPTRPRPGYESRRDELASVDASGLSGKRIAIDPGHGGMFRGAIGVNGLAEADVNLGVALELDSLLEAKGAIVLMTRRTDRDFVSPADSSLKFDLTERVRIANEFQPDLFLSIHHNADARGAHDVNETQTYYKLGDDGPSLDVASDVHRYLVRNLGIEKQRIMPGNYFVLRSCEAPALLTESSYLTNPDVEAKLKLEEKRRLEAEALYLGLARYFARHVPVIEDLRVGAPGATGAPGVAIAAGATGAAGADSVLATSFPEVTGRVRGVCDEISLRVDGRPVVPLVHDGGLFWRAPEPMPIGAHDVTLTARLAGEGTSRSRSVRFTIARPPGRVIAEFPDQTTWSEDQPLGLRVRVLDDAGLADSDSLRVRVRDVGTRALAPADTEIVLANGEAWAYFRAAPKPSRSGPRSRRPEVRVRARLWPAQPARPGGPAVRDTIVRLALVSRGAAPPLRTGFALRMPDAVPLVNAPNTLGASPEVRWINRDGFVRLASENSWRVRVPALAGYRRWGSESGESSPHDSTAVPTPPSTAWPPRFVAICGGALHGHRITLDPAGGGDEAAGTGPSGTRASSLNLEVARALAGFLSAAGAEVRLTRAGDYALSDVERVQISENFHAERFLRIGHAPEPPMIGHYFSSPAGHAWAVHVAAAFGALAIPVPHIAEDAQYPLQQTSCPALYVSPARVDVASSEDHLLSAGVLRAEAYALFIALAREWADAGAWPPDSIVVHDASGRPLAGVPISLGGALTVVTDRSGLARFARTELGPIEVEATVDGTRMRRVLLESERGLILSTGSTGR
jgi:N-acetylmuramoyl-L-alanine amidase